MPTSFQEIFDKALADYREQIGVDLDQHTFIDELQGRDSPDDVLKLIEEKANAFKVYRDGNRKLINFLSPIVHFIHVLSGVVGDAAPSVSSINGMKWVSFSSYTVRLPGAIQTIKGDLCWRKCPNHGACLLILLSTYIQFFMIPDQAADGVSSSYDALVESFERIANSPKRLRIYTDIPMTPSMKDISIKIMAELLSVFALATKQIKQGRFSELLVIINT